MCAYAALLKACEGAGPAVMEPLMAVEVLCPEQFTGPVIGDLNRRRGRVNQLVAGVQGQTISAEVPLEEMFGYVASLRSLSSGTASFTMQFARYGLRTGAIQTA
jgi:elongation factor G